MLSTQQKWFTSQNGMTLPMFRLVPLYYFRSAIFFFIIIFYLKAFVSSDFNQSEFSIGTFFLVLLKENT